MCSKGKVLNKVLVVVAFVSIAMSISSCSASKKVDDIEVTSVEIANISPNGLKAIDAVLLIGVDNPTFAFTLSDIEGTVYYNGDEIATYSGGPISIDARCEGQYELPCSLNLSPSFSLFTVMKVITKGNLEGLTTDVKAKAKLKSGLGKTLKYTDMPLQDLLKD